MRQCVLNRGARWQIAWIPSQFAVVGKYLRLLDENGWRVVEVGAWQKHVELPHGYLSGGVFHR